MSALNSMIGLIAKRSPTQIILSFLAVCSLFLYMLVHLFSGQEFTITKVKHSFDSLKDTYLNGGITEYLDKKEKLKQQVASTLSKDSNSDEAVEAANIAVFLFPDVLPDNNFERQDAVELWLPSTQKIEAAPNTLESREQFEELKANIWNYENPDKQNPQLSAQAQEVIRIYDEISKPK